MTDRSTSEATPRRTRRGVASWLLPLLGVLALVLGGGLLLQDRLVTAEAPRDLDGDPVRLEEQDTPAPEIVEAMDVDPGTAEGDHLRVDAAGLDVPIGTLSAVDGEITPPGFTEAYYVRNLGVDPDAATEGTLYLVTHSVQGGNAPGNALIDVGAGSATVAAGDVIEVGDLTYRVDGSLPVDKDQLASTTDLWTEEPGRLVLITCLQRTEGRSVQNVVITATLEDPAG